MNKRRTLIQFSALLMGIALMAVSCSTETTPTKKKKAGFSGEDLTESVIIERDRTTKTCTITILEGPQWRIYAGPSDQMIDLKTPIAKGEEAGSVTLEISDSTRTYFQVVTSKGRAIMAERALPITNGSNYRDLGGYKTTDGRYVKWGRIMRSRAVANLSDKDKQYLESIPIRTIVDLRGLSESPRDQNLATSTIVEVPFQLGGNDGGLYNSNFNIMYANMVVMPHCIENFKQIFGLLSDEKNVPLIFHCSAGKDRTGVTAALILAALGVDRKTIESDFMLSCKYYNMDGSYHPTAVVIDWIRSAFAKMDEVYGSPEEFISGTLGVDLVKFRKMYLY